jgi:hypothetical protein
MNIITLFVGIIFIINSNDIICMKRKNLKHAGAPLAKRVKREKPSISNDEWQNHFLDRQYMNALERKDSITAKCILEREGKKLSSSCLHFAVAQGRD